MSDVLDSGFSINFNPALLKRLSEINLKIDELFLAVCLYNNWFDLIDSYMGNKTREQRQTVLFPLVRKQVLLSLDDDYKKVVFTAEGARLIVDTIVVMNSRGAPVEDGLDVLVKEYIELFPRTVKNQSGTILRSHPADVKKKLKEFIIKYKYDDGTILRATKRYLARFNGDYSFCPAAMYFIGKNNTSALAAECQTASEKDIREEIANPFEEEM